MPRVVGFATGGGVSIAGATGGGAGLFTLETGGVLYVGMGGLELAWAGRESE